MGATVSNTSKEIKIATKNKAKLIGSTDVCDINHDGVKLSGLKNVNVGLIKFTQRCKITREMYFKALIEALTDLSQQLDEETKAALGISVSNTATSIQNSVENLLEIDCGKGMFKARAGPIEILDSEDSTFEGIIVEQDGEVNSKCTIDAFIDDIAKVVDETKKKTTGSSVGELLFGDSAWIFGLIIAVVVIGALGRIFMSRNKNDRNDSNSQEGGSIMSYLSKLRVF